MSWWRKGDMLPVRCLIKYTFSEQSRRVDRHNGHKLDTVKGKESRVR